MAENKNTGLCYGLCEKYGIDYPPDAKPREVWDILADNGIYPPWHEKGRVSDVYKMNNEELFELGNKLGVEMPDNDNLLVYRARIAETIKQNNKNRLDEKAKSGKIKLTKQDFAKYYKIIGDEQHGEFIYKTKDGGRAIKIADDKTDKCKLVFDNGRYEHPQVQQVYEYPSSDVMNDAIKELIDIGVIK